MPIPKTLDERTWLKNRIGYYLSLYRKSRNNEERRNKWLTKADYFAHKLRKLQESPHVRFTEIIKAGRPTVQVTFINKELKKHLSE